MAGEAWYLIPSVPASGSVELDGPEGRHAVTVRRTRVGEQIVLTDGAGRVSRVQVTEVGGGRLTGQVLEHEQLAPPAVQITVAQAIPKGDRGLGWPLCPVSPLRSCFSFFFLFPSFFLLLVHAS